jgi:hypothetical protein
MNVGFVVKAFPYYNDLMKDAAVKRKIKLAYLYIGGNSLKLHRSTEG